MVVGLGYLLILALFVLRHDYTPMDFVHLGTVWSEHDPDGTWGYDGQFYYQLAKDPLAAHRFMDNAAFRYQRILYPLVARLLALGDPGLLPLTILAVNWLAVVLGMEIVAALLREHGLSVWYSLPYGLYYGQVSAFTFDLAEPFAFFLVCAGIWLARRGRIVPAAATLGLATLARETAVLFAVAYMVAYGYRRRWAAALWFGPLGVLPLLAWLLTLAIAFGGTGVTFTPPFERVPFSGVLHHAEAPRLFALLIVLIVVPTVVAWAVVLRAVVATRLRPDRLDPLLVAWALNLLLVTMLSHRSYEELISSGRIGIGAVLAGLAYGATVRDLFILRASLYHVLACTIYVAGVWLGIRSLIVR